ncbi:MAG: CPXCG motif-containing cysteine-rich protein [Myxococcus sp.]|nr:CPXCG motif-containing cysteine-rich protein [Myxococcus sp.]
MASPAFHLSCTAGRRLFEARRFHAAHDAFEEGWRVCRGDEKRVLQVLVLWAAALHQHERGRGNGARRLLARALERLGPVDERFDGLDADSLKSCVIDTWGQLISGEALSPRWPAEADRPARLSLEHDARCPYCAQPVLVTVELEEADGARCVDDCPCCGRQWAVHVRRDGNDVAVAVHRLDA